MLLSTDESLVRDLADSETDFIYLDGSHSYENVRKELPIFYRKIRPGGVLAGHDYCNYGEPSLACIGCDKIPLCGKYTERGIARGKSADSTARNQAGVVQAVQEWLVEEQPNLHLYHTKEDFTR